MKISDLLYQAVNDKNQPINKEQVRATIKVKGQRYLNFAQMFGRDSMTKLFLEELQKVVEDELTHKPNDHIQCMRGCSSCCHAKVTVGEYEAHLLVGYLRDKKIDINLDQLETQSHVSKWDDLLYPDRQCVFLTHDNACSVYDVRPGACRKHLVTSDPEICKIGTANPALKRVFNLEAEVLVSTFWQISKSGNLPNMVKAELERNED